MRNYFRTVQAIMGFSRGIYCCFPLLKKGFFDQKSGRIIITMAFVFCGILSYPKIILHPEQTKVNRSYPTGIL